MLNDIRVSYALTKEQKKELWGCIKHVKSNPQWFNKNAENGVPGFKFTNGENKTPKGRQAKKYCKKELGLSAVSLTKEQKKELWGCVKHVKSNPQWFNKNAENGVPGFKFTNGENKTPKGRQAKKYCKKELGL